MSTHLHLGIESEFFLVPRRSGEDFTSLEGFANLMTTTYNQKKSVALPKMHIDINRSYHGRDQATEWTLTDDGSLKPDKVDEQCKRGPFSFFTFSLTIPNVAHSPA